MRQTHLSQLNRPAGIKEMTSKVNRIFSHMILRITATWSSKFSFLTSKEEPPSPPKTTREGFDPSTGCSPLVRFLFVPFSLTPSSSSHSISHFSKFLNLSKSARTVRAYPHSMVWYVLPLRDRFVCFISLSSLHPFEFSLYPESDILVFATKLHINSSII